MRAVRFVAAAVVCVALIGCDSPTKPTAGNFTKAIDAYFRVHRECLTVPDRDHPLLFKGETEDPRFSIDLGRAHPDGYLHDKLAQLDALAAAGLLTRTDTGVPDQDHPAAVFTLTQPGAAARADGDREQAAITGTPAHTGSATIPGPICFARRKVASIDNFSLGELGVKFAEVQYSYTLADKPAWANTKALQEAYPQTTSDPAGPVKDHITLQLTANGWSADGK